jgi:hypothetical protein
VAWTSHGYWMGRGDPDGPPPPRRGCGGPHRCPDCALEAQAEAHAAAAPRREASPMAVTIGVTPEPRRLIAMLRIIATHARDCRRELAAVPVEETIAALAIIARHADGCADELEALDAIEDEAARQRADDDGWPPTG